MQVVRRRLDKCAALIKAAKGKNGSGTIFAGLKALARKAADIGDTVAGSVMSGVPLSEQLLAHTPYFTANQVRKVVQGDYSRGQTQDQKHRNRVAAVYQQGTPEFTYYDFNDKSRLVDTREPFTDPTSLAQARNQKQTLENLWPHGIVNLMDAEAQNSTALAAFPTGSILNLQWKKTSDGRYIPSDQKGFDGVYRYMKAVQAGDTLVVNDINLLTFS